LQFLTFMFGQVPFSNNGYCIETFTFLKKLEECECFYKTPITYILFGFRIYIYVISITSVSQSNNISSENCYEIFFLKPHFVFMLKDSCLDSCFCLGSFKYTEKPHYNESEGTTDFVLYSRGFVIARGFLL